MPGVTGAAELADLATSLADLESTIVRQGIPAMAQAIGAMAASQYAGGRGPDGRAWPRNKDGSVPLLQLTAQIRFAARGRSIVATAPDVLRHHTDRRPIFPAAGMPAPWSKAATLALEQTMITALRR